MRPHEIVADESSNSSNAQESGERVSEQWIDMDILVSVDEGQNDHSMPGVRVRGDSAISESAIPNVAANQVDKVADARRFLSNCGI